MILIDRILEEDNKVLSGKYNSAAIFYHLVRYYSNGFKGWGKNLLYSQLNFLNDGKKKHELLNLFSKNRTCEASISDNEVLDVASKLFDFIENMLVNDIYPHTKILEMFKDMKPFDIPDNFRYERRQSYSYREYNDDYTGTYAHDVMGYTNDEIDTIFDGAPDAYWNID